MEIFLSTDHADLDLRLLGPVRARHGGTERVFGPARRTAVLAVLALHAGRAVSREQLLTAVWGDDPPVSAVGNLYTYVSALRRELGPTVLGSQGGTYRLHAAAEAVDVFRFEALRERSRRHRADGDRESELAALGEALRLWHGEALAGVPGPFATAQRLRLTELRLATAERHATLLIEAGRATDAATALRELAEAYPEKEGLRTLLATAETAGDLGQLAVEPGGPELAAAVHAYLAPFGEEARQLLRAIAFLGVAGAATPDDLATATGWPVERLRATLAPVREAGVLDETTFRQPAVARILHDGTPGPMRVTLHRAIASRFAAGGGPPERVVAHLLAGPVPLDHEVVGWLAAHVEELATRAPDLAVAVLRRTRARLTDDAEQLTLTAWLARLLHRRGESAFAEAGWVAARTTDPGLEAEMHWVAALSRERRGEYEEAAELARAVLGARRAPLLWLDRFRTLVTRLRPHLPGLPTAPEIHRSQVEPELDPAAT